MFLPKKPVSSGQCEQNSGHFLSIAALFGIQTRNNLRNYIGNYIGTGVTLLHLMVLYTALSLYLNLPSVISVSHHLHMHLPRHLRLPHHMYVLSISTSLSNLKKGKRTDQSVRIAIDTEIAYKYTETEILQRRKDNDKIITINILLFLKVRDFWILCGKIS
jgi:hypothetical protein